jgi:hypothetical protein
MLGKKTDIKNICICKKHMIVNVYDNTKNVYCYYYCLEYKDEKNNNRKKLKGVCQ